MRREMLAVACGLVLSCGEGASDGLTSLVRLEPEGAGGRCAGGGTRILSGPDSNRDGTLQDGEVTGTSYVCSGTGPSGPSGPASLLRLEEEGPGGNCPAGGTKVSSGADTDGDGTLQDGEVESTTYVCSGADGAPCTELEGSLEIRDALDWRNLVGSGCTSITGSLTISAPDVAHLPGEAPLYSIGGDLVVASGAGLTDLGTLSGLHDVGGSVKVLNTALTSVSLPALKVVRGNIEFHSPVTSLALPAMYAVVGSMHIESSALTNLEGLGALARIGKEPHHGDGLTLVNNPSLTSTAGLRALTRVDGRVHLESNPALADLNLPALTAVGGGLFVDAPLTNLTLPSLISVSESLVLTSLKLTKLDGLDALTTVGKNATGISLLVYSSPLLTSVSLPALSTLSGDLRVENIPALNELNLPALTAVGRRLRIDGTGLTALSLQRLSTAGFGIEINSNTRLASLNLPALTTLTGELTITRSALSSLEGLDALSSLTGYLSLSSNPNLAQCLAVAFRDRLSASLTGSNLILNNDELTCP